MRSRRQREVLVEEGPAARDDLVTADLVVVVAGGEVAVLGHHVAAVERVVERAPPRVDRVGGEPGVEQRDHELRAGDPGHLVVDVAGGRRHLVGLVEEVADLAQEGGVGLGLGRARVLAVPVVDRDCSSSRRASSSRLRGARSCTIASRPVPERLRLHARPGQRLLLDEPVQAGGDVEAADLNALVHVTPLLDETFPHRGTNCGAGH